MLPSSLERGLFILFYLFKKGCFSSLERTLQPKAAIRCRRTDKDILFKNLCTRVEEGSISVIGEDETWKGN